MPEKKITALRYIPRALLGSQNSLALNGNILLLHSELAESLTSTSTIMTPKRIVWCVMFMIKAKDAKSKIHLLLLKGELMVQLCCQTLRAFSCSQSSLLFR